MFPFDDVIMQTNHEPKALFSGYTCVLLNHSVRKWVNSLFVSISTIKLIEFPAFCQQCLLEFFWKRLDLVTLNVDQLLATHLFNYMVVLSFIVTYTNKMI